IDVTGVSGGFTVSFKGPDANGTVVTNIAGIAYDPSRINNNTLTAAALQAALNSFSNIGGVGGSVSVAEPPLDVGGKAVNFIFTITFRDALSYKNVAQVSGPGSATLIDGGPLRVVNGTP